MAYGGSGGGCIKLDIDGSLVLNGTISADGENGKQGTYPASYRWAGGGGSGGSIWIDAGAITGSGEITANGGDGGFTDLAGGGGGGRIALYYNEYDFSGNCLAIGGIGRTVGGTGTIFMKSPTQQYGSLIFDNNGNLGETSELSPGTYIFDELIIKNQAHLNIQDGVEVLHAQGNFPLKQDGIISISENGILNNDITVLSDGGTLYKEDGANLICNEIQVLDGGTFYLNTSALFQEVYIASGGTITHSSGDQDFHLSVSGDLVVDAEGMIDVAGKGHGSHSGLGKGNSGAYDGYQGGAGGAGYGGDGGNGQTSSGGSSYGNFDMPLGFGSGGGYCSGVFGTIAYGGNGGGCIKIDIDGSLVLNGIISANGENGHPGTYPASFRWTGGG